MSWFLGYSGRNTDDFVKKYFNSNLNDAGRIFKSDLFVVYGGHDKTCFTNLEHEKGKYLIVGVPLQLERGDFKILTKDGIDQQIDASGKKIFESDGHYAGIQWSEEQIVLFTDRLGLRDIYFAEYNDGILFSTRQDYLLKFIKSEIVFEEFGSKWLYFNQLSRESFWKNVKRLSAGDNLTINKTDSKTSLGRNTLDLFRNVENENKKDEYANLLQQLILFPADSNNISLSLSGGMDSRVLLSFLLKSKIKNWDTHTFGNPLHPDGIIASQLTEKFGFRHIQINEQIDDNRLINQLEEYVKLTGINNTPSSILQFYNYEKLGEENRVVIDGGYGEIWRREFSYRLYIKGKDAIRNKNLQVILSFMTSFKADIFSEDIIRRMNGGALLQIENLIAELPSFQEIGIGNWLDLIALKIRLPNYFGPEQVRVDELVVSYMPFIQIPLIKLLPGIKMCERENGRMLREILKKQNSGLTKIPLVKGNTIHPFCLTSLQKRIWSKTIGKMQKGFIDTSQKNFHYRIKNYILDIFHSQVVKECDLYDHDKLSGILNAFEKGVSCNHSELDWLLGFEIFRRQGK